MSGLVAIPATVFKYKASNGWKYDSECDRCGWRMVSNNLADFGSVTPSGAFMSGSLLCPNCLRRGVHWNVFVNGVK